MIEKVLAPMLGNSGTLVNDTVNERDVSENVTDPGAASAFRLSHSARDPRRAGEHFRGRLAEVRMPAPKVRLPLELTNTDSNRCPQKSGTDWQGSSVACNVSSWTGPGVIRVKMLSMSGR